MSTCAKVYFGYHLLAGLLAIIVLLLVTTGILDGSLTKVDAADGRSMDAASYDGRNHMLQLGLESFLLGLGGFALMHFLPKLWQPKRMK